MSSSESDDDPIIAFRRRKNQLALIHRDLALNAEGIRIFDYGSLRGVGRERKK